MKRYYESMANQQDYLDSVDQKLIGQLQRDRRGEDSDSNLYTDFDASPMGGRHTVVLSAVTIIVCSGSRI